MERNNKCLSKFIYKFNQPCVFKTILKPSSGGSSNNSACTWTPKMLADLFKSKKLTFRIGKKNLPNSKKCFGLIDCAYK